MTELGFDEAYVGMNGPRPFGVFDTVEGALTALAKLGECSVGDIVMKYSFNGDILLLVRNYPEARLIRTRLY